MSDTRIPRRIGVLLISAIAGVALGAAAARFPAQERAVTEREVPPAALAALRQLAQGAAFTEFAAEVEHGATFYEGSWKGPQGAVDGLVTAGGDVVELEEEIGAESAPAAVRAWVAQHAGGAGAGYERKTLTLYEVRFRKGEKSIEVLLTPDGRVVGDDDDDDDDDDEDDKDDEDDDGAKDGDGDDD